MSEISEDVHGARPTPSGDGLTASDRLAAVLGHPGPFVSVYLATLPLVTEHDDDTDRRWLGLRRDLERQEAPAGSLDAIDARLALPAPPDTAAIGVLAAADGTTVVDYALEPPAHDVAVLDRLPYVAPMFEWAQRRVPHLVVTLHDDGADLVTFGHRAAHVERSSLRSARLAEEIGHRTTALSARLVVVAGPRADTNALRSRLSDLVRTDCRIVVEPSGRTPDELAEATVRHVSDVTARATVDHLRELRFLAATGGAVDGIADTVAALRSATVRVLLVHDDPRDQRRIWIGADPTQIHLEPNDRTEGHARLVDACIAAAVTGDAEVHIVPTTGPQGPADDLGALTRRGPTAEPVPAS